MNAKESEPRPVLEFHRCALAEDVGEWDLRLGEGDLALVEAPESIRISPVGDLALGLRVPHGGEVRFEGRAWTSRNAREAERCRRCVGRVYVPEERAAWLQNLDLDENIPLAQHFDPAQSRAEIARRAMEVAGELGFDDLPRMRPAVARRSTLVRAQWVRAFLPKDLRLLILERPTREADAESVDLLRQRVDRVRNGGTAVLWLDEDSAGLVDRGLRPTNHFTEFPAAMRAES